MANTTLPGILAFTGLDIALPARSPGCLGVNDAADPRALARLGDTPGCAGVRDRGDPTLPGWNPTRPRAFGPARTADGVALAPSLATPPLPPPPVRPPWMAIAEEEARKFKGATESTIEKSFNYATAVHTGQKTMIGNDHPWCAAFVNWCLMKAGIDIENPTFADNVASKGRAHGFSEVKGERLASGIPTVRNPRFLMLDGPVFGSIAMVTGRDGHGHHVGFVYSRPEPSAVVLLGGNQADRIMFQPYRLEADKTHPDHLAFFCPASFPLDAVTAEAMDRRTADELNILFGVSLQKMKLKDSTK